MKDRVPEGVPGATGKPPASRACCPSIRRGTLRQGRFLPTPGQNTESFPHKQKSRGPGGPPNRFGRVWEDSHDGAYPWGSNTRPTA